MSENTKVSSPVAIPANKVWGASPEDWNHFEIVLGLGEDLLPVVSNLKATISPRSTIKALGKVPSLYNKEGHAMGIGGWTEKKATSLEIAKWSKVRDYGICLQTRKVKAIDIDIGDEAKAQEVEDVIVSMVGALPKRYRSNSGKRLLLVRCEDDADADGEGSLMGKRVLKLGDGAGIIELLCDGQQCIVTGTHDSGVRYEWVSDGVQGALPDNVPQVSREVLDKMWERLSDVFTDGHEGSALVMGSAGRAGRIAAGGVVGDETADMLEVLGLVKGNVGREGQLYIECPWVGEHSARGVGESETGTAYFPAGGRGYERGHFKCLHAHCLGRSDMDFKVALGLEEEGGGFEVVTGDVGEGSGGGGGGGGALSTKLQGNNILDFPLRTNDDGKVLAVIENLTSVLSHPDLCDHDICYDMFRDEIVYKKVGAGSWLPFKDTDYTKLRINLALTGFLPISRDMMRDAVHYVANVRRIDSAQEWLNALPPWDGVPRVSGFLRDYMGCEDSDYHTAVSEYIWVTLAGRVLDPGCKADAAPIFVGEQYVGKSFAIAAMVPSDDLFVEIKLDDDEDKLARKMRGKLIAEFAELRGLHTKELEGIKAFVSRQKEEWVPKYAEFATSFKRRLLFIGSSNKDEFFNDETGERRWLPTKVTKGDCVAIARDRDQLWAEGAAMFRTEMSVQKFYEKANELASSVRSEFMITDAWDDVICKFLHEEDADGVKGIDREFFMVTDVMRENLNMSTRDMKTFEMMRIGKILRKYDCHKMNKRINGILTKVWAYKGQQTNL